MKKLRYFIGGKQRTILITDTKNLSVIGFVRFQQAFDEDDNEIQDLLEVTGFGIIWF